MAKPQLKNMQEKEDGYYDGTGRRCTNFTITNVLKVIKEDYATAILRLEIKYGNSRVQVDITLRQIRKREIPFGFLAFINDEEMFYKELYDVLQNIKFTENDICFGTNKTGLQRVNDCRKYVFSNGSIDKNTFDSQIFCGYGKCYMPEKAVAMTSNIKTVISQLFEVFYTNPNIYLPLFYMNIMTITNGYFREIGESKFMKIMLWIVGSSSSGKTELALNVGNFVAEEGGYEKRFTSVTGTRKEILEFLRESSGIPFILDDVKKERVRDRKNGVRSIIDDCIRSIYQGKLTTNRAKYQTSDWIDTSGIITGEYLDTEESQNNRIFIMDADGFLQEEKNSKSLRKLQENPLWVTSVCVAYIQWLLGKMDEENFSELVLIKLKEIRNENR